MDTNLFWWHSDGGVLPAAPWTTIGADPLQLPSSGGLRFAKSAPASPLYVSRAMYAADSGAGPIRANDDMQIQFKCQGTAVTPGWATGAGSIGAVICDGSRIAMISIWDRLRLVDPATGAVYFTDDKPFPWLSPAIYRFRKKGSEAWILEVNGVQVLELPYLMAPATGTCPAWAGYGCFDPGGAATATFDQLEGALNLATPPQGLVERLASLFPVAVRERWTSEARGLLRAIVGAFQGGYEAMLGTWGEMTSGAYDVGKRFTFSGKVLPSAEQLPWTATNPGAQSVVRERVRMAPAGGALTRAAAFWDPTIPVNMDFELIVSARLDMWDTLPPTPDAWGRVGAYIQIDDTVRTFTAQLITTAGGCYYWVLTSAVISGAAVAEIGQRWQVGRFVSSTVEIRVFGRERVILIVNGEIVDRQSYSVFPASAAPFPFGAVGAGSAVGTYDWSHASAIRRLCDLRQRIGLVSRCQERMIAVGGCERNDELEAWKRNTWGVQQNRGTTRGIGVELARLSCCGASIVVEREMTCWILEKTWPEITPVYLDTLGYFSDVFVEFCGQPPNFTIQELADYAAAYLVPFSVGEFVYYICLNTQIKGAVVSGPFSSDIPVDSDVGFVVGDSVQVRPGAGTSHESVTLTAIAAGPIFTVSPALVGAYGAGDFVRKVLATT